MMRAYELMVIVDGDVEDPKAQSWIKFVTDEIAKVEAALQRLDALGGGLSPTP